jgi:hypothetical protein
MKEGWGISADQILQPAEPTWAPKAKRKRKQHRCFAILPCFWADQLDKATRAVSFKVAHHLLRESFIADSTEIPLSTICFRGRLTRRSKFRALEELEALGLVTVGRRGRKVPLVRLHHLID